MIDHHGPLTLGALAEFEGVAPPSITKVVAILEEDGLVTRSADPTDRRVSLRVDHAEGRGAQRRIAAAPHRVVGRPHPPARRREQQQQLADALDVLDSLAQRDSS